MQDFFNSIISQISRVEEYFANTFDEAQEIFETELNLLWNSTRVDVINIVWMKQFGNSDYKHIANGKKPVDCNPLSYDRTQSGADNNCYVSLYDRVVHIENTNRWAITVVLDLENPLPWEA